MPARLTAASYAFLAVVFLFVPSQAADPDHQIRPGDTVIVSADSARIGVGGKPLASLHQGTTLKVLAVNGDWIGVSVVVDERTLKGWVKRSDVELQSEQPKTTASLVEGFWPQFHGPKQDNTSEETGLLIKWPDDGPRLLWTAEGIGFGYAAVSVAAGRIYTAGNADDKTVITAIDGNGQIVWQVPCGPAWEKEYPGTRATPTFNDGRLYHQSPLGDVVCLDAKTGNKIWGLNSVEQFGGEVPRWGLCESLVIDGNRVICCPGGDKTAVVALDKLTGKTVWKSPSAGDVAGYATPILVEHQGLRMIITMTAKAIGEEVWRSKELDNHHGGVLLLNGHLYGSAAHKNNAKWICLDWNTGEMVYADRGVGKGSLTYADGMLYCLGEKGTMGLVKPAPTAYEVISQFKIPEGPEGPSWAHPVVCGGRLYIRHGDRLYAYLVAR
jgi:outer membrane protein assembly factor BamB